MWALAPTSLTLSLATFSIACLFPGIPVYLSAVLEYITYMFLSFSQAPGQGDSGLFFNTQLLSGALWAF